MPFNLPLAKGLKKAGWKVKIHDFERLEDPHVTIYCKLRKWRLSLRTGDFLDVGDKWSQIDEAVKKQGLGDIQSLITGTETWTVG